jgi:hypothetical protein
MVGESPSGPSELSVHLLIAELLLNPPYFYSLISLTRNVTRSLLELPLAQVERQAKLFRARVRGREHAPRNSLW